VANETIGFQEPSPVGFFADMGVSITTVGGLRAADHDAVHLREEGLVRLSDLEIASKAARERRSGFRGTFPPRRAARRAYFDLTGACESGLASGAKLIFDDEGCRVRRLGRSDSGAHP
jgi:hypothetical protein